MRSFQAVQESFWVEPLGRSGLLISFTDTTITMKNTVSLLLLSLGFLTASTAARADGTVPYANIGTPAAQSTATATGNAGIGIWFAGSNASFDDYIQVYDVNNGWTSGDILYNHTDVVGSEAIVGDGNISSGDTLVFYIHSPQGLFASDASYSADGINHAYMTSYAGGNGIPAGTFVGFEDEVKGHSDLDYNDDTFVFTGINAVTAAPTPEPGSIALLGTGTLSLLGLARRRFLGV